MEKLIISEQDIVNAICIYLSRKYQARPEEVEVELIFDDEEENGFSAEAFVGGQKQNLLTIHIIEALRLWIDEVLNKDPLAAGIKLLFDEDEGIIAAIH